MKHKTLLALIVGSILVVVLTACATPQHTPTAFPTGTFVAGSVTLELKADGTYTFIVARGHDSGPYTVMEDQIVFGKSDSCPEENIDQLCCRVGGLYNWTYDSRVLSLKKISDKCAQRTSHLIRPSYTRKP